MARPDPKKVPRRPMARAGREFAFAKSRPDVPAAGPLFSPDGLDIDALAWIVDRAESVIEGRPYDADGGGPMFFGSAVLTLVPDEGGSPDSRLLRRLVDALADDERARRVVQDRIYREMARLLGPFTPEEFEIALTATVDGPTVRIDVDIEAPLARARSGEGA